MSTPSEHLRRHRARARIAMLGATASLIAATMPVTPAIAGNAATKPKPTLTYFLPKTVLEVEITQRLVKCPVNGGDAEVVTAITVKPVRAADLAGKVVLDAGSGPLAKRTVKLELNADQTLAAFNSTSEGQGGPILKSLGKLAFKVAAAAAGGGPMNVDEGSEERETYSVRCNTEITEVFDAINTISTSISDLEKLIAEGKGNPAATALLSDKRARRSELKAQLSLTKSVEIHVTSAQPAVFYVEALDYTRWFEIKNAKGDPVQGAVIVPFVTSEGFRVAVTPNYPSADLRTGGSQNHGTIKDPVKHLFYRLPVPATVEVQPCGGVWSDTSGCAPLTGHAGEDASLKGTVALMQLSQDFILPVGKGGMFGSRQAAAKFDAQGAPVMLEYGSSPGTADAAGVVDTLGEGLDTLRDAETAALQREIAREKARKELRELREAAETSE